MTKIQRFNDKLKLGVTRTLLFTMQIRVGSPAVKANVDNHNSTKPKAKSNVLGMIYVTQQKIALLRGPWATSFNRGNLYTFVAVSSSPPHGTVLSNGYKCD